VTRALTGTTRELACLALGHDDADEPACASSDEDLVRQLVEEVQALRVAAGIVEESEADRDERVEALGEVLAEAAGDDEEVGNDLEALHVLHLDEPDERILARYVIDRLDASGWTLHPVRRP
jgi:hypothetical protein